MKFHVMDHTGHSTEDFDTADIVGHSEAMARFEALKDRKFAAFRKDGEGQHTMLKVFDPEAAEVLFVPALQGG